MLTSMEVSDWSDGVKTKGIMPNLCGIMRCVWAVYRCVV